MQRKLFVIFNSGETDVIPVKCGSSAGARWLPARIGRALAERRATARLDYDEKPRTAVKRGTKYYMRLA